MNIGEPRMFPGVVSQRQRRRSSVALRGASGSTSNLSAAGFAPGEDGDVLSGSVGSLGSVDRRMAGSSTFAGETAPDVIAEAGVETDED